MSIRSVRVTPHLIIMRVTSLIIAILGISIATIVFDRSALFAMVTVLLYLVLAGAIYLLGVITNRR